MAYDFLKKYFGTQKEGEQAPALTFAQLEAAIAADKDVSIVNLKEGGYVSKEKFDAKETELKGVQTQLTAANQQIQSFKDMDVDGIKKQVTDWETRYNEETQKLQKQLSDQERAHAEEMFLSHYNFTSKAAKAGVLADLRAKEFKIDGGVLLGAKEFMDSLMADEEYKGAFVVEEPEGGKGKPDGEGGRPPRFSGGTNGGNGSGGSEPTWDFGFTQIRKPEK